MDDIKITIYQIVMNTITFFPQISIAPKTMTATTKDFAQTEHACVNQAGKVI